VALLQYANEDRRTAEGPVHAERMQRALDEQKMNKKFTRHVSCLYVLDVDGNDRYPKGCT
jgi:hypothetical protein